MKKNITIAKLLNLKMRRWIFIIVGGVFIMMSQASYCATEESKKFSELALLRYSSYSYDDTRAVPKEILHQICLSGRMAPSSYNEQPWNYIICDRHSDKEAYEKALSTLVPFNQDWASHAPVLIISVASTISSHKGLINAWAESDTGAATYGLMLQATALGLNAHQMAGFDKEKVKELFFIPEGFFPISVMALGYTSVDDKQTERKRKSLQENFFYGKWGVPFKE